jgi:hypothetical protein
VLWWPCIIFNCHNCKVIKVFGTTGPQKYVWNKWRNNEELRCRTGLPHWWLGRRTGMLKQHPELHGSWRDCNQIIRKLMTSRSQLLNTHGWGYTRVIWQKDYMADTALILIACWVTPL